MEEQPLQVPGVSSPTSSGIPEDTRNENDVIEDIHHTETNQDALPAVVPENESTKLVQDDRIDTKSTYEVNDATTPHNDISHNDTNHKTNDEVTPHDVIRHNNTNNNDTDIKNESTTSNATTTGSSQEHVPEVVAPKIIHPTQLKKRLRRAYNLPSNKILRSRTQKQQDSTPQLTSSIARTNSGSSTRAAAVVAIKKNAMLLNQNDSERTTGSNTHRQQSKRNSRHNKMLPKKLSSRSVHPSTTKSSEEDELQISDIAVDATTATAKSHSIVSNRIIQEYSVGQYRIINPLIADYNEVLYSQQQQPSSSSSSKPLSLVQIQQITSGISFAIPDTYSIRYMAQLLGIAHIFQDLTPPSKASIVATGKNTATNNNYNGKISIDQLQQILLERSNRTNISNESNLGTTRNEIDPIYDIPAILLTPSSSSSSRINFWTTNTREELDLLVESSSILKKQDQRRTRNYPNLSQSTTKGVAPPQSLLLDPFYIHLWQSFSTTGNHPSVLQRVPITSIQHAKIFPNGSSTITGSGTDDSSIEAASLQAATTPNKNLVEDLSSDPNVVKDSVLDVSSAPSIPSIVVPLLLSPCKEIVVKEQFTMSPQQRDVLQYVMDTADSSTIAHQRYIFLPFEQAMEKYPQAMEKLMSRMNIENSTGVHTGWIAIDTTTTTKSILSSEENDNERNVKIALIGRIVGLVLYQLEWCVFAESIETSVEMIVHVLGIYVDDTQASDTLDVANNCNYNIIGLPQIESRRLFDSNETSLMDSDTSTWLRLVLLSLVLEHARRYNVWYAIMKTAANSTTLIEDRRFYEAYFNMVPARYHEHVMICDLNNVTVRYTFLQYQEKLQNRSSALVEASFKTKLNAVPIEALSSGKQRWLVRLPTTDDVQSCLMLPTKLESSEAKEERSIKSSRGEVVQLHSDAWQNSKTTSGSVFSNPSNLKKGIQVSLSVALGENLDDEMTIYSLNVGENTLGPKVSTPSYAKDPPSIHIMRNFPLPSTSLILPKQEINNEPENYPILSELMSKQQALRDVESGLEPTLYKLLHEVVSDRLTFESPDRIARENEEIRILKESEHLRERCIEQDLALQKRLEQDMDAVCEICLDGEVTPDNQILFCESCNVAVHQMCYGIDRVPEGDYYCVPCRRLGYDRQNTTRGRENESSPLSICCELCPLRNGAFVRTDIPPKGTDSHDKFVHVLCAKWQGLNHVGNNKELVEDVTNIRRDFRRHHVKCHLCLGERGGMNKCKFGASCKKWFHVTCARAVGTMKVIHGENCHGDVEENAWNLFCPEHSDIATGDIPDNAVSVEMLIKAAKQFPPEEAPPPPNSQFITLTGPERRLLLSDLSYEQALTNELLRNKFYGVRCEICDFLDDESKTWTRCVSCNVIFCRFCKLDVDEVKGSYKCVSCKYVEQKTKAKEQFEDPQCCTCVQVGGLLRGSYATPISSKFKRKPEYKESLYAKQTWVHSLCAIWLPDIELPRDVGTVDLSGVICVTNRGTSMIHHKRQCFLCGQRKGLKMLCDKNCWCKINGQREKLVVHVTCARQAGLEVRADDERLNDKGGPLPYVRCYRHCGNEFNLRAKLEDLIEIERKRAGKEYIRADAPMKLSEASRLLYSAIQVMRIFGWAWRWAEWWVDYNSSWEPLLEPGQNEKDMTKEELKIVDSTRESRCEDARRCRLAAFGAALRNRLYDTNDGFKRTALDKALRAILNTTSLVGPLTPVEIDFYIDWLGRAYRSKSRLLYMGRYKNAISSEAPFCLHEDGTPKYELGNRRLPGEQDLPNHIIFETDFVEVDGFLRDDVLVDDEIPLAKIQLKPKAKITFTSSSMAVNPIKKKLPSVALSALTPLKRSKRFRHETKTCDDEYVPNSDAKRRRSATAGLTAGKEQPPTSTKKRGRPPRSFYTEDISDSISRVAGISVDDTLEHDDAKAQLSDLCTSGGTNVTDCTGIATTSKSVSILELGSIQVFDRTPTETLQKEPSDSSLKEETAPPVCEDTDGILDEMPSASLHKKPAASKKLPIKGESSLQTRLQPKRSASETASSSAYISVKSRKREPTRPFTYEHHEMKGLIRKRNVATSKNDAPSNTVVPKKELRPRVNLKAVKVEATDSNAVVAESDEPAMPELCANGEEKEVASSSVPPTSCELVIDQAAIETEVDTPKPDLTEPTFDANVKCENDETNATVSIELTAITGNNLSTVENILSAVDTPRTTYTKIRRPGRPRSKNKPPR